MRKELEGKLIEKYPEIFCQKSLPMSQTAMCWGIETGNGWFGLISALCSCIDNHVKNRPALAVEAVQVKEKYGGLRFYINGGDDFVEGLIEMAETMSYRICDVCGAPGKRSGRGWITTRCDKHFGALGRFNHDGAENE